MPRHTQAIIDVEAIKANYQLAEQTAPESKTIAVIKADAYGHGSVKVAEALQSSVPAFAVAIFEEAVVLREAGITKPILILQGINDRAELEYAANHNIWTMIDNDILAKLITDSPLNAPIKAWVKLDTGMHRLGLNDNKLQGIIRQLKQCPWVDNELVLVSHLANASDIADPKTRQQVQHFTKHTAQSALPRSLANSAAILGFPETHLNWNRPGIMLYGLSPFDKPHPQDKNLTPAMTFTSTVISIRKVEQGETIGYGGIWQAEKTSTIATIAVGYADGYPRHAVNGTPLLIAGQKASLAGRVSMDMITADISHCTNIKIGDPVELWGKSINANTVADYASTIGYDLLTGVSQRVPRVYR